MLYLSRTDLLLKSIQLLTTESTIFFRIEQNIKNIKLPMALCLIYTKNWLAFTLTKDQFKDKDHIQANFVTKLNDYTNCTY